LSPLLPCENTPSQKHEKMFFLETLKLFLVHIQTLKLKISYTVSISNVFSNDVLLSLVKKTKQKYVLPLLDDCIIVTTSFDL
jgi:hypothetical protein